MAQASNGVPMHRLLLTLSLCVSALCCGPVSAFAQERDRLRIAVEGGFPPFNYLDAKDQLQGFDIEIANAICEAGKFSCDFIVHKWDTIIPDLLAQKYDVIISSMSMSEERRKLVDFTARYYTSPSIFIARKDGGISSIGPEVLEGLRIGVTYETTQAAYVRDHYKPATPVTIFPNSPALYEGLARGDVDIIMEDKLAVFDWLNNTKAGSCCAFVGPDISEQAYFGEGSGIALRPGNQDLRDRIDAALAEIQKDGTYDMINAKYFPFSIR